MARKQRLPSSALSGLDAQVIAIKSLLRGYAQNIQDRFVNTASALQRWDFAYDAWYLGCKITINSL